MPREGRESAFDTAALQAMLKKRETDNATVGIDYHPLSYGSFASALAHVFTSAHWDVNFTDTAQERFEQRYATNSRSPLRAPVPSRPPYCPVKALQPDC